MSRGGSHERPARGSSRTIDLISRFVYLFGRSSLRLYERGGRIRGRRRFKRCGDDVRFSVLDTEISFEQISVGSNVFIGRRAYLSGPCDIGSDVMFGPEVQLMAGYHRTDLVGSRIMGSGGDERRTIYIEDDVWIGARSTVMKGIRIGEGAVVGTGSLVLTDVPPYTIVAGSPATIRKLRFTDDELRRHIQMLGGTVERANQIIERRSAGYVSGEGNR